MGRRVRGTGYWVRGVLWVGLAVCTLAPASARGQGWGSVDVIEPGREAEVLGLLAPFRPGGTVEPGWRVGDVRIERSRIRIALEGRDGETATVMLTHPSAGEPGAGRARSASFAIGWQAGSEESERAARAIAAAVAANDPGGFWRMRASPAPRADLLSVRRDGGALAWLIDGTTWLAAGFLLLLGLVARQLRDAPRAAAPLLLGATLAGALYRIWLAPETVLGAWPYSRTVPLVRRVWEGPGLATLSAWLDTPFAWFDFVTTLTLLFAVVTPLAVFAHVRALVGETWTAVLAAALVAVLPMHVRFSHSEVEFVPSIVLSSCAFAMVHVAVKDADRRWRTLALAALPVFAVAAFVTRPLNVLFLPLLLVAAGFLHRGVAPPRARRVAVAAVLLAAGTAAIALHFVHHYAGQVRDGSDLRVLAQAAKAAVSLRWNTLIHPGITPPALLLFAVMGAVWSWRGERRLVLFLVLWLTAFFVTHAYVLPEETAMQARYHLHLVAPFVILAALGLRRLLARDRRAGLFALAVLSLSPLVHLDFVRDVAFDDLREHAFVSEASALVPDGCTVLEYTGPGRGDHDARWARLGTVLDGFTERRRWTVQPLGAAPEARDPLRPAARAALRSSGGCVFYYEGIPCWSEPEPDPRYAPACAAVGRAAPLETLAATRFPTRAYDGNLSPAPDVRMIRLSLHRVRREGQIGGEGEAVEPEVQAPARPRPR